ncbi:MAG: sporulation related protein [Bacteroidetes bacterium]|jgi:hypothetical protein|nr:sporulation related protein [Bacteroidota bacterium]
MKLFILIAVAILFCAKTHAQSDPVDIQLKKLQEKKADYHKSTDGEYDGYRIKIHSGPDRSKAMEIKSKFLSKYGDYGAYDEYQVPSFVIVVGDFKSKPDAYGFLKKIQYDFPSAFIIRDRIKSGKK